MYAKFYADVMYYLTHNKFNITLRNICTILHLHTDDVSNTKTIIIISKRISD